MMKLSAGLKFIGLSLSMSMAVANTDLLLDESGSELDFSNQLAVQKDLKLDDSFRIQLFSRWKAKGVVSAKTNIVMDAFFAKKYQEVLKALPKLDDPKVSDLKKPMELYLLHRLGLHQSFFKEWISFTSQNNFLKTETGLALDQVIAKKASELLISSGFTLDKSMRESLKKTESFKDSRVNISLQAFKALKSGEDAVQWIGKLALDDELRVQLAHTSLLAYGKKGKLGASGKFIKKVVEPWMEKSEKSEEIALYYLTLGRLLYQARAFKAASSYYKRIPESSEFFLQARTENLWSLLQQRDFSQAMGELVTLKLGVFEDQFYPEVYLASAIGHTMLCQFSDARKSIHQFVSVNKKWAQLIGQYKESDEAPLAEDNFYSLRIKNQLKSIEAEQKTLAEWGIERFSNGLSTMKAHASLELKDEAKRQWRNKEKILDSALYKMKFVRIELISRMHAVAEGLKDQLPTEDMVQRYDAATVRKSRNELVFPHDGMFWSDELFNMSAEVTNNCMQGKFYEK